MTNESMDNFTLYTEGDKLYDDMLVSIGAAKSSISLESYIFAPDSVGLTFIDALVDKAMGGVKVRLHLDAFGSSSLLLSPEKERLKEAGVELKWFNTFCWYKPHTYNRRNHRKLLIVDGNSAWLGGFNIHRENSLRDFGRQRWLDTQVRIDGPLAEQAQVYFDRLWQGDDDWTPPFDPGATSRLVSNHNWFQRHQLRREVALRMHKAEKRIWLCTPYFMPDSFMQKQLVKAARRGVDVRLLLPHKSDRPETKWVAHATYTSLMAAGIRIFEFEPRFIHAKMMIIDDGWCTIGSSNLDYRSFFINYEINLVSTRQDLIEHLQQIFDKELIVSREIEPRRWSRRGWQLRTYIFIGSILRSFL